MKIGIIGPMTLYMKDQGTYTRSKVKHNKKEMLCSITPQEEEISILTVDIEEEEEEEEEDGPRSRTYHLLQLRATRTLGKGLSESLHYIQLLQLV
jgi:hypothetical protein